MRTFEEFAKETAEHPWLEGCVSIYCEHMPPQVANKRPEEKADWLSFSLGHNVLGDKWRLLNRENFQMQLVESLSTSLAYSVEMLPKEEATKVADEFIGYFGDDAVFLVNGTPQGWNPITKSTMETAYVVAGCTYAGMFLFEDED